MTGYTTSWSFPRLSAGLPFIDQLPNRKVHQLQLAKIIETNMSTSPKASDAKVVSTSPLV